MKTEDSQSAAIDQASVSWFNAGCPYQMVAQQLWKEAIEQIQRRDIIAASPENKSLILAAAIAHSRRAGEICRMIFVANEAGNIDNFEYYSKILWLLYAQAKDVKIRAKIILALDIAPGEHARKLHLAEDDAMVEELNKGNFLGHKEAMEFCEACYGLIKYGAAKSILQRTEESNPSQVTAITQTINDFLNKEACLEPEKERIPAFA